MRNDEDARRAHILDAAERLLRHYGPYKTTIAEIAREASIGVGTVYLTFPSKEAIIEELSHQRHARVLAAMQHAAERAGRGFAARFPAMMEARVTTFFQLVTGGAHARDLLHCTSPAVKAANEQFRAQEHALLVDLLKRAHRAGELDVKRPDLVARVLLRAYASFTPPWVFALEEDEARRACRCLHDLLLHGLLRRAPARARPTT